MDIDKLKSGLSALQAEDNKRKFGTNRLSEHDRESLWQMFCGAFDDIWIKVLVGALFLKIVLAVVSAFVPAMKAGNDVIEIVSIVAAIVLATGFSTLSEYRNTTRSAALQEEYAKTFSKVVRDGEIVVIPTQDIVIGDTVLIQAGDKVPVDGLLFEGSVKVSQAALNGESRDEDKYPADSYGDAESTDYSCSGKLFMGSVITSGQGYMVATVIGDSTELGKINKSLSEDDDRIDTSALKLEKVAKGIGKLGVSAAVIAGVLQVVITLFVKKSAPLDLASILLVVAEAVMLMASIVIMAVPEGLPMMNSLVQSMNTESMYEKHILVSHKSAFSDSAYMNILFTDKTGTITNGNLSLVEFISGDGQIADDIKNKELMDSIALNNLARISDGKAIGSNNMDRALLDYAISKGFKGFRSDYDRIAEPGTYDSEKKCAETRLKDGTMYWKGATENIIGRVTHYTKGDEIAEFTQEDRKMLDSAMTLQSSRTMKLLSSVKIEPERTILLAVLCLRDDVRKDAVDTVNVLHESGIQVVMVTGDAEDTAVAMAKESGILSGVDNELVFTHERLESMSDDDLKKALPDLRVVSRAKPLDKKRLVSVSQKSDDVCGMTGDGVNDAPALKQADVGFAMGDGTAVAQEAGDVIILNNSLTSIKDCILNSRTMAKSVGKFLIFQLTVNVCTLLMNIIAPILGWTEPFSIVQILWINLIMDTLAAMAFGGEPILDRYMKEKPSRRADNILTGYIKSSIASSSVFITIGSLIVLENLFGLGEVFMPAGCTDVEAYRKSLMFAFFIYSIIFNSLNTRSEYFNLFEHMERNKKFALVMGSIFVMQTIIIEFGGKVFGTIALDLNSIALAIAMSVLIIPFDLMRKVVYYSCRRIRGGRI